MAELRLPDAAGPYAIEARVIEDEIVRIEAMLGGIVTAATEPRRRLSVLVRTGSAALDNTNYKNHPNGTGWGTLPIDGPVRAVRESAWLPIDRAYKGSVEALAAKIAAE